MMATETHLIALKGVEEGKMRKYVVSLERLGFAQSEWLAVLFRDYFPAVPAD